MLKSNILVCLVLGIMLINATEGGIIKKLILLKILSKQQKEQQAYAAAQQQQAYGATQQHQAMPLYMAPAQVQMSYAPSGGAGGYGADSSGYGGYGGGAGAVGAY